MQRRVLVPRVVPLLPSSIVTQRSRGSMASDAVAASDPRNGALGSALDALAGSFRRAAEGISLCAVEERGWGWPASETRRAQLVEWVVSPSSEQPDGVYIQAFHRAAASSRWFRRVCLPRRTPQASTRSCAPKLRPGSEDTHEPAAWAPGGRRPGRPPRRTCHQTRPATPWGQSPLPWAQRPHHGQ